MPQDKISFYRNARDNTGNDITIRSAIDLIKGKALETQTFNFRIAEPGKTKDEIKKTVFPAVTWSGLFSKRQADHIRKHSGRICLDIDKLAPDELARLHALLKEDPHTHILFISPSGTGLKLIFKIDIHAATHLQFFLSIESYIQEKYSVKIDPSGKDVCRLCFLCYDPNAYYSDNCTSFQYISVPDVPVIPAKKAGPPAVQKFSKSEQQEFTNISNELDAVFEFTKNGKYQGETIGDYRQDKRNIFLFVFACNCCRKGIPETECSSYVDRFAWELDGKEVAASIRSAYNKNFSDYGKYAKRSNAGSAKGNTGVPGKTLDGNKSVTGQKPVVPGENDTQRGNVGSDRSQQPAGTQDASQDPENSFIKFWYTTTKTSQETGKEVITYQIDYLNFIEFLKQQGFARYRLNDGYQFIRVLNKKIQVIRPDDIKDFVLEFCYDRQLWEVYKMLLKGNKSYLGTDKFQALPYLNINIKKDVKDECYLYFANCIVTITKDNVRTDAYTDLNQHIWDGQVNKHDFTYKPELYPEADFFAKPERWKCEFARFINCVAWNPNNEDEKELSVPERFARFCSFATSIGFLLHSYKHPAYRKGIFAIDHKISDKFESNGRSGKSILPAFCSYMKVVSTIPGKQYDPNYQFRYEAINIDTQIINYNDMKRTHDVENEFEIIADNYSINKRNTGFLFFKYSESAKVYYSTNHIPKGDGESYRGRMHIIEFSDFFNASHTPFDFFKHSLFDDWDTEQWNHAYNFAVWCIQLYISKGLISYPNGNFNVRKLIADCPEQFIDWCDMTEKEEYAKDDASERIYKNLPRNKKLEKKLLYQSWVATAREWGITNTSPHMFTKWTRNYCKTRNLIYHHAKPGGIEYYWIITPDKDKAEVINPQLDMPF